MLQKTNGQICQEDIKEDNKRPFLANIFFRQTKRLGCIGEEAVSSTGHSRVLGSTGYLSVGAPHGESPGLLRESHIFHRKNSISCHGSCVQQEQVTLPGERAYGKTVSPPKAPEMENSTRAHTRTGRFLSTQRDVEAPRVQVRCRLLALSKLVLGSRASCWEPW